MTAGPPHQALWARLRAATGAAHAQAEVTLDPLTRPASRAEYAGLLTTLWGFQAPAERLLGRARLPAAVRWADRARLGALDRDLADLGVRSGLLPLAGGLGGLDSPGSVWGALYVVEGMTLGGRVIQRRVQDRVGGAPDRFLAGRGECTRPMWRELGAIADASVRAEREAQAAERAAAALFAAFTSWAGTSWAGTSWAGGPGRR